MKNPSFIEGRLTKDLPIGWVDYYKIKSSDGSGMCSIKHWINKRLFELPDNSHIIIKIEVIEP